MTTSLPESRAGGVAGSVVIPAHDEEAVIERCLRALLADTGSGELEVVVVVNGSTDATAERARAVDASVQVIEIPTASKIAALRAGDEVATAFPRAYLDADVEVTTASLAAVARELADGVTECAAPTMVLELTDRPWFVRAFFETFGELPYLADGLIGNGLYVLSAEGRGRFDEFPDITADDLFIRNLFSDAERAVVPGAEFRVHPPRTLRGLLAIRERTYRGNAEYDDRGFTSRAAPTLDRGRLLHVARRHPIGMAVYLGVNLTAKARLRFRCRPAAWERDDSARGG